MKKYILLALITTNVALLFGQNVGINDDNSQPDASAMLDIKSDNKGLLVPRVQLDELNTTAPVTNPSTSLLIYANSSSTVDEGYYYWDGSQWVKLITGVEITDNDNDPTNELQTIRKSGNIVTLSNEGGSFTDEINDGDTSSTNEIQDLNLLGNILSLSEDDTNVDLSSFMDNTDNQTLSISGSNLSISGGNSVILPSNSGFADTDQASLYETADWFGNSFINVATVSVDVSSGQEILLMYSCDCISSPGGGTIELEISGYSNTSRSVYCGENGESYPASNQILITAGSSSTIFFTLRARNAISGYSGKVRRLNLTAIVN